MKVAVFTASKGGTGKTTLAFNVGLEAAKTGSVFFVDQDPQKSLTGLLEGCKADASRVSLLEDVGSLSDALRRLKKAGYDRDYMFIDTPGSFMNIIKDAIEVADCLVLPLQASPLDFLAQKDVAADIEAMGKKDRTVFVLNKADMRSSLTAETLDLLGPLSPHPPMIVHQRVAYPRACIGSLSAGDLSKEAAKEVRDLWEVIRTVAETKK